MNDHHEHRPGFWSFLRAGNTRSQGLAAGPLICKSCGAKIRQVNAQKTKGFVGVVTGLWALLFLVLKHTLGWQMRSLPRMLLCAGVLLLLIYATCYVIYRLVKFEKLSEDEANREPWENN